MKNSSRKTKRIKQVVDLIAKVNDAVVNGQVSLSQVDADILADLFKRTRELRDAYIRHCGLPAHEVAKQFDLSEARISQIRNTR